MFCVETIKTYSKNQEKRKIVGVSDHIYDQRHQLYFHKPLILRLSFKLLMLEFLFLESLFDLLREIEISGQLWLRAIGMRNIIAVDYPLSVV